MFFSDNTMKMVIRIEICTNDGSKSDVLLNKKKVKRFLFHKNKIPRCTVCLVLAYFVPTNVFATVRNFITRRCAHSDRVALW